MTRRQIVLNLVAAGLQDAGIAKAMDATFNAAWDAGDADWDAFLGHMSMLYRAPESERRALLRATCRAFDIEVPAELEDDPHEQCTLF